MAASIYGVTEDGDVWDIKAEPKLLHSGLGAVKLAPFGANRMLMLAKGKMYLVEKKKVEPLVGVAQAHIVDFAVSKMEEESQH